MKFTKRTVNATLSLIRAGLWGKDSKLLSNEYIDLDSIYRLAEEQAVVGLVTEGLNRVVDTSIPKEKVLSFVGATIIIEHQNTTLNDFASKLSMLLKQNNIDFLMVKGQGVAQCYDKPLWRSPGDIDLLFDNENYEKAKLTLFPLADAIDDEDCLIKHQAVIIKGVSVELHGKIQFTLSNRVQRVVDDVVNDSLAGGARETLINGTAFPLPNPDNDTIIVFTHMLHHFFIEGVGLRQICDWCRLLWTYRDVVDKNLLGNRLRKMGLMSEWTVFASLAVNELGMSKEFMPYYKDTLIIKWKTHLLLRRILKCGNLGHNNNKEYRVKYSPIIVNTITMSRRVKEFMYESLIFPKDAPLFFIRYVFNRLIH